MRKVNRKYSRTVHNRPMKRNRMNESIRNRSRSRSYRRINEAVGDVVLFSDLNREQKQYVLANWYTMDALSDLLNSWYSDDLTEMYEYSLSDIASKYEKLGVYINTDKIYWESSSQGPYYDRACSLGNVIDGTSFINSDGGDVEVSFPNSYSPYVENAIDGAEIGYYGVDEYGDEDYIVIDYGDLKGDTYIDDNTKQQIFDFIHNVEDALADIWNLIYDTCISVPDDDWVEDMLLANDRFGFEIIDDKRVKYV